MKKYIVTNMIDHRREVIADKMARDADWLIFSKDNPCGGPAIPFLWIKQSCVSSVEVTP